MKQRPTSICVPKPHEAMPHLSPIPKRQLCCHVQHFSIVSCKWNTFHVHIGQQSAYQTSMQNVLMCVQYILLCLEIDCPNIWWGCNHHMGLSWNRDTPKSSISMVFSFTHQPFWGTPIYGNPHMSSSWFLLNWPCRWPREGYQVESPFCGNVPQLSQRQASRTPMFHRGLNLRSFAPLVVRCDLRWLSDVFSRPLDSFFLAIQLFTVTGWFVGISIQKQTRDIFLFANVPFNQFPQRVIFWNHSEEEPCPPPIAQKMGSTFCQSMVSFGVHHFQISDELDIYLYIYILYTHSAYYVYIDSNFISHCNPSVPPFLLLETPSKTMANPLR